VRSLRVEVEVDGPPLTPVDRFLRWWRIRKARRYIPSGARVLDVGCHDGTLFRTLSQRIVSGVGVDPALRRSATIGPYRFSDDVFPGAPLDPASFEAITFLAVLEHVDDGSLASIRDACERLLVPGGVVIVTVPSPAVDGILHLLQRGRLVAGIATHQHHGADPASIADALGAEALTLVAGRTFQLGLNNLFVFRFEGRSRT
jgi:2-polyprenyl-3-methyl-5-hydroxy-6-metoxy-1,4-benzoquinol methylase